MSKWVCQVCGYVHEGDQPPEECPVCHVGSDKFTKQDDEMSWAAEHVVGVAQGVSEDILADLKANFEGECSEVGMYLAMARVAHRRLLTKKQSTLQSLQNCWATLLPTAPRRTWS